jgi:LemA protein
MKKLQNLAFILTLCVVGSTTITSCGYNTLVTGDENTKGKWAQVENQYQRRADLIPNLVNTVKGAADFEKGTLEAVISARASATQIKLDANDLSEENIKKFEAAQNQLSGALSRLMMVTENYPTLRANEGFKALQDQLEGTENRITVARGDFNEAVQTYNGDCRSFPSVLSAKMFGFKTKGYFEAKLGSDTPPTVDFGTPKK